MTNFTRDVLVLLEEIDKIIIDIETKQIPKSSSDERQIFLEGKAAGLNEAYRMIKRILSNAKNPWLEIVELARDDKDIKNS